jgi:uncharacterized protein YccT (UPF0319 family)
MWAANLNVTDNLIVTEINNKVVDHGIIGHKSTFSLEPGNYALIIHYKDVFEDLDFAEDRVVKSKEFVVKLSITTQKQLKLATVSIKNLAQAEAYAKSPELTLTDENNKQLALELVNVSDYKITQKVDIAVNSYVAKQAINNEKPLQKSVTIIAPKIDERAPISQSIIKSPKPKQADNTLIQVKSLTMLKFWWQNASDEEKKQFKRHISTKN